MQRCDRSSYLIKLWLLTSCALAGLVTPAQAQIVPDNTLGNGNNSVTNTINNRTDITGGLQRNSALFHSFSQFNINTNQQVYFANPAAVRNIFSRVTGGNLSNIDGLLGVSGTANLFLINPNGIIFGPNARLDVAGSFLATTANAFEFPDNQRFAANGNLETPLVEVNIPIGLQFGANPPAMLVNQGNLTTGQNLSLIGGNLLSTGQLNAPQGGVSAMAVAGNAQIQQVSAQSATLFAANYLLLPESRLQTQGDLRLLAGNTVWIRDSAAQAFLAISGGNLLIQGNQGIDILALSHPQTPFQSGGNLTLVSDGVVSGDAHFAANGNFSILNLSGQPGTFVSKYDPVIRVNGNVAFGDYTGTALLVEATGNITGGDITITGPDTGAVVTNPTDPQDQTYLNTTPALILRAGLSSTLPQFGTPTNPLPAGFTSPVGRYALVDTGVNFTPQTLTGTAQTFVNPGDDTISTAINLPFDFNYFGTTYNEIFIGTNGFITPVNNGSAGCCSGGALPSPFGPNGTIAGFWEDLNPGAGGTIRYQTFGTAAANDRIFVVEFADVPHFGGGNPVTMQFQIFENSAATSTVNNRIEVQYISAPTDGGIHSAGIENASGTEGVQFFRGTTPPFDLTNRAVRYVPVSSTATGSIQVNSINTSSTTGVGGPVILDATGDVTVTGDIKTNALEGSFSGGLIRMTSNNGNINLSLGGGSINSSSNRGVGGSLTLRAPNGNVQIGDVQILTSNLSSGRAGDIDISGNRITLINSFLDTTAVAGSGGNITLGTPLTTAQISITNSTISASTFSTSTFDNSGQIRINGNQVDITDRSSIDNSTSDATGRSIDVSAANGNVTIDNSSLRTTVALNGTGSGGDINITTANLTLINGGRLEARTFGSTSSGNTSSATAGNINITGTGQIIVDGYNSFSSSGLFTSSESTNSGPGGTININTGSNPQGILTVSNGAVLSALTRGNSAGGNIDVNVNTLNVLDGGQLIATTSGSGAAGDIIVQATNQVNISGFDANYDLRRTTPTPPRTGSGTLVENSGNNNTLANARLINDNLFSNASNENVQSSTDIPYVSIERQATDSGIDYFRFTAQAGDVGIFDVDASVSLDSQIFLFEYDNSGPTPQSRFLASNDDSSTIRGGQGSITSLDSYLRYSFQTDGDYILGVGRYFSRVDDRGITATSPVPSPGSGYNLQLSVGPDVAQSRGLIPNLGANSGLFTQSTGTGLGGTVTINTPQLSLNDRAQISASTAGLARGGSVNINAPTGSVSLSNASISAAVIPQAGTTPTAAGVGGGINITANSIDLTNRASLNARTGGPGVGGNIQLIANNGTVSLTDSSIDARTLAAGRSGSVTVNAGTGSLTLNNSTISNAVGNGATGQGNRIDLTAADISVLSGSRVEALTFGSGAAGDINVTFSNLMQVSGSNSRGLFSGLQTSSENVTSGAGGTIAINQISNPQGTLQVANGGFLNARTLSENGGGSINIFVNNLEVTGGGQVIASTAGTGAAGSITVLATHSVLVSGSNPTFNPGNGSGGSSGSGQLTDAEPNDTLVGAQLLDADLFSLDPNADIANATLIPHLTINGTGNGTYDYYSFEVETPNTLAIFDVDRGYKPDNTDPFYGFPQETGGIWAQLFLFDSNGAQLGTSTYSLVSDGGGGSTVIPFYGANPSYPQYTFDPFLEFNLPNPGTYTVAVARIDDSTFATAQLTGGNSAPILPGNEILNSQTYTLQVSLNDPNLNRRTNPNESANSGLLARAVGSANAGNLSITTPQLTVQNGASIAASTEAGTAGNIRVDGRGAGQVTLSNGAQISGSTVGGRGGTIDLTGLNTLQVTDSLIAASTTGTSTTGNVGSAGAVTINAAQSVNLSGTLPAGSTLPSGITAPIGGVSTQASNGNGSAGAITVNTNQLTIQNGAAIAASTDSGIGNNIVLNGLNTLQLNNGEISATTENGVAGNVVVNDRQTPATSVVLNSSEISVTANGSSRSSIAGQILLNTQQLSLQSSLISASTEAGVGQGIVLQNLDSLQLNDSQIQAATETGTAGDLLINDGGAPASTIALSNNSALSLDASGNGSAGDIRLNTQQLALDNSRISAATQTGVSSGTPPSSAARAGNVTINVSDAIDLDNNSQLSVRAGNGGTAGDLTVNAGDLNVNSGSQITVSSPLGQAGNLVVITNDFRSDQGTLSAETGGGGANIDLTVKPGGLLLMRNASLISANASGSANGGTIKINAPFVIGLTFENSDIVANATAGNGGTIDITTNAIFGLQFRPRRTPRSDITASSDSGASGNVAINTLNIDVSRGLSTPPVVFTDVSQVVSSACEAVGAKATASSELRITGRGGVPLSPTIPLSAAPTTSDWVSLELVPEVSIGVTFSDGSRLTLEPGQTYQAQALCVTAWKAEQQALP